MIGKLDKSICLNCTKYLYDNEHRCKLYIHKSIDSIHGGYNTEYELCKIHNNDGNCPFFEAEFNKQKGDMI